MARLVRIAPSILSADFGRLAEEVARVDEAGADLIHVDVMDGRFVPNLTIGPVVVEAVRRATKKTLDVHLMIVEPERYVEAFAAAGADIITVHMEASIHLQRNLSFIRSLGKRAGVSLNPHTHEDTLDHVLEDLDLILVMSVNPGFGGQAFLRSALKKIRRISEKLDALGNGRRQSVDIEVDGGINASNASDVVSAGADILVAGSAVFKTRDYRAAIERIRQTARQVGEDSDGV